MSDESLNANTPRPPTSPPSAEAHPPEPGGPPPVPPLAGRPMAPRRPRNRALRKPTENEVAFTPEQRRLGVRCPVHAGSLRDPGTGAVRIQPLVLRVNE